MPIKSEFGNQVFTGKLQTFYDELVTEGTLSRATMNGLQQMLDEQFKKRGLEPLGHSGGGGGGGDRGNDGGKPKARNLTNVPKSSDTFTLTSPELAIGELLVRPQNHQGAGVLIMAAELLGSQRAGEIESF